MRQPVLYGAWHVTYAILLFTTPYPVSSVLLSLAYIFVVTRRQATALMPLAPYEPAVREALFLVVGESHHPTKPEPSATPAWLTIPAAVHADPVNGGFVQVTTDSQTGQLRISAHRGRHFRLIADAVSG